MRLLLFAVLFCGSLFSQELAVSVHDPSGVTADTPLTSNYQFGSTPVGGSNQIVLRFTNVSSHPIEVAAILVGNASGSAVYSPNFSITGLAIDKTLAANSANFEDITLSFTPQVIGAITGYLQATYQIVENGCDPSSGTPGTQCPSKTANVSTLSGSGSAAQLVLTYAGASGTVTPQPNSPTPISFGNVSTSATSSLTFSLTNQSAAAITAPLVALRTAVFGSTAFTLNTANLPATIPRVRQGSSLSHLLQVRYSRITRRSPSATPRFSSPGMVSLSPISTHFRSRLWTAPAFGRCHRRQRPSASDRWPQAPQLPLR